MRRGGYKVEKTTDTTREGYTFVGWYRGATFTTEFDFHTDITTNINLYSQGIFTLMENNWTDSEVTATTAEVWHSFAVEAGKIYRIWWNGQSSCDGSKTLTPYGDAWYADSREIFFSVSGNYNTPRSITATSSGKVFVRTRGLISSYRGTFGIVYSTSITRPAIE